MENKLKSMMEYQKFENNPRLEKLIRETESRWSGQALEDDDLDMVFAAKGLDDVSGLNKGDQQNAGR